MRTIIDDGFFPAAIRVRKEIIFPVVDNRGEDSPNSDPRMSPNERIFGLSPMSRT